MNILCGACSKNHHFTGVEIERMLYALEADCRADAARVEIKDGKVVEYRNDPDDPQCFIVVLRDSFDGEVYLEHVDAMLERRRRARGTAARVMP